MGPFWLSAILLAASVSAHGQSTSAPAQPATPAATPSIGSYLDRQMAAAARVRAALEKQQSSVRQQTGYSKPDSSGFFILAWQQPIRPAARAVTRQAVTGDCAAISEPELQAIISRASAQHSVEPNLIRAVIDQESGAKPCAVSPKGAQGLMQLMPGTQSDLGVSDPFDPAQNIMGGVRYLRQLLDRYQNSVTLALAAYNAGPARVDEKNAVPNIPETEDYVSSILEQIRNPQIQ